MSYFFKAILPLKPATIVLKIGHLAFQVAFNMLRIAAENSNSERLEHVDWPYLFVDASQFITSGPQVASKEII